MHDTHSDPSVLRDLALLYLSLAHDTDQDLEDAEVEVIATHLHAWQDGAPPEVVTAAIRDALEAYAGDAAEEAVRTAVGSVRTAVSQGQRQRIVEDLVEVAVADDRFLHEESTFIGELARAWDVHLGRRAEEDDRRWSILSQDGQAGAWTPMHDLALLYVTLAHSTDDALSPEEVLAITAKLGEWLPDAKETDVMALVREAIRAYAEAQPPRDLPAAVEAVARFVPAHQRPALLADLRFVALADGVLLEREHIVIDEIAHAWGLPLPQD